MTGMVFAIQVYYRFRVLAKLSNGTKVPVSHAKYNFPVVVYDLGDFFSSFDEDVAQD